MGKKKSMLFKLVWKSDTVTGSSIVGTETLEKD